MLESCDSMIALQSNGNQTLQTDFEVTICRVPGGTSYGDGGLTLRFLSESGTAVKKAT